MKSLTFPVLISETTVPDPTPESVAINCVPGVGIIRVDSPRAYQLVLPTSTIEYDRPAIKSIEGIEFLKLGDPTKIVVSDISIAEPNDSKS